MKQVIITGGSDGLGYELSKQLLEKGVEVICLSRTKPKDLTVAHIPVDLTDQDELHKALDLIKASYSRFDVLINNAGRIALEAPNVLTFEATNSVFQLNVIAPMLLTSGLFDLIKKNEADIVNVASTVGYKAYSNQAAYGASKWGLRGFSENLRLELKDTKCRVIHVAPGGFQSKFVQKFTGEEGVDLTAYLDPRDVARMVIQTLEASKDLEVSEIILSRKRK